MQTLDRERTDQIAQVIQQLRLGPEEIAHVIGVSVSTLQSADALPPMSQNRLDELASLADRVKAAFFPAGSAAWLSSPSRILRGAAPLDVLREGRIEYVDGALEAIDSGVYT